METKQVAKTSTSAGNALVPFSAHALALHPGSVGSIDAYIQAVNRVPMRTHEEELRLARTYRDENELDAAGRLCIASTRSAAYGWARSFFTGSERRSKST